MYKLQVIAFFCGNTNTAAAIGITQSAVAQWPKIIPARRAYEIERLTEGELKVDPELYSNK